MPTALAIVPHPDDESYAFGGLLALLARAGWRCEVHCASSGERGQRHDGGEPGAAALAAARERELAASCTVLGVEPPQFWRLPDGELAAHDAAGESRARIALEVAPDLLLTLGPDGAYGHPDHLAVHRWVTRAWETPDAATRPPLLFAAFPLGLFLPQYEKCIDMLGDPPSPPREVIGSQHPDLEIDIRAVAATKLAAIAAHRTQLPGGDPHAIFPPAIIAALLETEGYTAANPTSLSRARSLLPEATPPVRAASPRPAHWERGRG